MRVVFDTNILVSSFISPFGSPARVVDLLLTGTLTAVLDDRILAEYTQVLKRPRFEFNKNKVGYILDYLHAEGDFISPIPLRIAIPDNDDLMSIETAATQPISPIVTGNKKHFPNNVLKNLGVSVFNSSQLLEQLTFLKGCS